MAKQSKKRVSKSKPNPISNLAVAAEEMWTRLARRWRHDGPDLLIGSMMRGAGGIVAWHIHDRWLAVAWRSLSDNAQFEKTYKSEKAAKSAVERCLVKYDTERKATRGIRKLTKGPKRSRNGS